MLSRLLMVVGCATALSLLPVMSSGLDNVPDKLSADAHAQGKSGGNGGGGSSGGGGGNSASASAGGHGGGRGGGNGGVSGGGAGKGATQAASARGNAGSGGGQAQTVGELFGNFLKGGRGKPETAGQNAPEAKPAAPVTRAAKAAPGGKKAQQQAVLPQEVPVPEPRPAKERNFHAKLAGLNSLNRNYHAYLNAQDPRMTAIREYVVSSAEYDMTAAEREALEGQLADAEAALNSLIAAIEPYDGFAYEEMTVEELQSRLETLDGVTEEEKNAMTETELAAFNAEYEALTSVLSSEELASLQEMQESLAALEAELAALEGEITDEALIEALMAAANQNRLAEYGDDYVDEEMLNWAKSLLGVGEEDGKIDEVRTVLESEETPEEGEEEILVEEVETGEVAG